jgi:hypothetical protein
MQKKDAKLTVPDSAKVADAIRHVVHDYTVLLWCRWAVQQEKFEPIIRSHLAFSYFLPYRAFADFFSMKRFVPNDPTTSDIDVHAIDFSGHPGYEDTQWKVWLPHMNTHLFHINYFRCRTQVQFDSHRVITALHPEFESNWQNFVKSLHGDFPKLFKHHIDSRRADFPNLTLYP